MKSVFNKILCGLIFLTVSVQANDVAQADVTSVESFMSEVNGHLNNLGVAINDLNFPLIGKLGSILPFALVSFSLRKFPGQTLFVAGGALLYAMYHNEKVSNVLRKYKVIGSTKAKKIRVSRQKEVVLEDDFFVFDGDDLLDAEEQEDDEEEFLDEKVRNTTYEHVPTFM